MALNALKRSPLLVGICLAASLLGEVSAVRANQQVAAPLRVKFEWSGSACQNLTSLPARIERRTDALLFVQSKQDITLSIGVSVVDKGVEAHLQLHSDTLLITSRTLVSRECSELLEALALISVIALDDQWQEHRAATKTRFKKKPIRERRRKLRAKTVPAPRTALPAPQANAPAVSTTGPPAPPNTEPSTDISEEPLPEPVPSATLADPQPPEASTETLTPPSPTGQATSTKTATWHGSFGADVRAVANVAPALLLGAGVRAQLRWNRAGSWSPHAAIHYSQVYREKLAIGYGLADFQMQQWTVELCPLHWRVAALEVGACGKFQWGSLTVEGKQVFAPQRYTRPWRAAGGTVRFTATALGPLRIGLALGASFPLIRDQLAFDGDSETHRSSLLTPHMELGLSWQYP